MKRLSLTLALTLLAACSSTAVDDGTGDADDPVAAATPFDASFVPPWGFETERMRLEPLRPSVTELDYDAFMSSIDHLQASLRWGSWPSADFELESNRGDLQRHWNEFGAGEAYAYTVLAPDRSRAIGCVYVNPHGENARGAEVAYWVTEDQLASRFDEHLLTELVAWFERDWPLDVALFPTHRSYERGFEVARAAGLSDPQTEESAQDEESPRLSMFWGRDAESSQ